MAQPILHPFLRELRQSDRLRAFAEAFPAAARVSEPALPLLLAALHEELERPLVLLAPEDTDARDAAEAAAWFLGDEGVALLPSRGVHWRSGLEPAPPLVRGRAGALGRRDRADARVLAVHPARAPFRRSCGRLPGGRAKARPRRADPFRRVRGTVPRTCPG